MEEKPEAVLIDVSNLLNQETLFTGLALRHGRDFNISICHPEFSSILEIGSNREDILFIRSQRAYEPSRIPSEIPNAMNVRELTMWQIGTALTLLPRTPLSFRKWDPRVEYFSNSVTTTYTQQQSKLQKDGVWNLVLKILNVTKPGNS